MHRTFTVFSNSSIIPPGFKFTELHTLTLATCSYALDRDDFLPVKGPIVFVVGNRPLYFNCISAFEALPSLLP